MRAKILPDHRAIKNDMIMKSFENAELYSPKCLILPVFLPWLFVSFTRDFLKAGIMSDFYLCLYPSRSLAQSRFSALEKHA